MKRAYLIVLLTASLVALADDKSMLEDLYSNPEQRGIFILNVERGDKESVLLAIKLRGQSDAGASSELNDALFMALRNQPEIVLNSIYGFEACNGRTDPAIDYETAINEVDSVMGALSNLKTPKAERCLNQLIQSKVHIGQFFGIQDDL